MTDLVWSDNTDEGRWALAALRKNHTVGMLLPPHYESYARLLHPIAADEQLGRHAVRWRDVASEVGGSVHPQVQFRKLAPAWNDSPACGTLPIGDMRALLDVLKPLTGKQRCWFCFWYGYAFFAAIRRQQTPLVNGIDRKYFLACGPIGAALALSERPTHQTPNLWWPSDRQWCVATEIDLDSTYVGGPEPLIASLLANPRLEALRANLTDSITSESDKVNAASDW